MKKVVVIVIAALIFLGLSSGAFCAQGDHSRSESGHYGGGHYYHHGGPHGYIGGYFGFPYYAYPYGYYPYAYPYYYPYAYPYDSYTYEEPPVYIEPEQPSYWYYCKDPQGYYPYVTSCPAGWITVVPTPPAPGKEGVAR